MTGMHHMLVHFPEAFWALATLMILVGALLPGRLAGATTRFSELLRLTGWEVYTTFYSPLWVIAVMVLIGLACAALGIMTRRQAR